MRKHITKYVWIVGLVLIFTNKIYSQSVSLQLGPDQVSLNQGFTITITIQGERLRSYDAFPDFDGFTKRGTSSSSRTNIVNGQVSSSQSITMTYAPTQQGEFTLPPFEMEVNGKQYKSPGKKVTVSSPAQRQQRSNSFGHDPLNNFFGGNRNSTPKEFVDVVDDAFIALINSKNEVFVGEGFTTTLAFYLADDNRAPLQFHELGKQLSDILKKVRPTNCWEENFDIENINGEPVTINNKGYTKYKIYQGTFYPLNAETIHFPSIGLEMIKYKVAKNPSFFGQNRQEGFKTFYSKSRDVKVKELPPHPLKDAVAVGDYRLNEDLNTKQIQTGQSFSYDFSVYGEGNVSSVNKPEISEDRNFDFYPPNIQQNINRRNSRVTGSKSFSYYGIPNEPGEYKLSDYFNWIFFNPKTEKYDTLTSELSINVVGESKKNEHIQSNDLGAFYDRIEFEDNELKSLNRMAWVKPTANIFILLLLVLSAFFIFKK
jgi:hypothetical protein